MSNVLLIQYDVCSCSISSIILRNYIFFYYDHVIEWNACIVTPVLQVYVYLSFIHGTYNDINTKQKKKLLYVYDALL